MKKHVNSCGILYIVVPCYNEEEALEVSSEKLLDKLNRMIAQKLISDQSKVVFVDDGSKDSTWEIISKLRENSKQVVGLRFAHNRGHQNAILAGMMYSKEHCNFTITIDADLQQDIEAMDLFIHEYYAGSEIVYGVRNSRKTDSFFKKFTATIFYKLMKRMGAAIYENSADYRLMSSLALDALEEYQEVNLFLRGIIPDIGLKSSVVHFDVFPRMQGKSKYSLSKMITLAADGITSFSIKPIRKVLAFGVLAVIIAIGMIIHVLCQYFWGYTVSGWSSILISMWFIGGAILISLGIIGEYIGRNYMESKRRPRYFFWEVLDDEESEE